MTSEHLIELGVGRELVADLDVQHDRALRLGPCRDDQAEG
jgi:hypothetical protein